MKKKILFLIPTLRIGGGAERVVSLLTTKLSEKYEIHIITFFHFKNLYPFKGKYYSLKENLFFGSSFFRIFEYLNDLRLLLCLKEERFYEMINFSKKFNISLNFFIPILYITLLENISLALWHTFIPPLTLSLINSLRR